MQWDNNLVYCLFQTHHLTLAKGGTVGISATASKCIVCVCACVCVCVCVCTVDSYTNHYVIILFHCSSFWSC